MKKFVLLNGYVEIDNEQFYLDLKNKEIKERGGYISIFLGIFLFASLQEFLKKETFLEDLGDYLDLFILIIGVVVLITIVYYLIFKKKWSKKNYLNEIKKIKLDKDEFETEVIICFQNKREIILEFRNLENQINPFIEELQKRNSRIIINKKHERI